MSDSNESPGEELRVLLHACKVGRTDIIQHAVSSIKKQNGNVIEFISLPGENGDTALHIASHSGQSDAVRALLNLGANPSIIPSEGDFAGKSAYEVATGGAKQAFHVYTFEQIAMGHLSEIRCLVEGRVSPNIADDTPLHDSALHWACSFGNVEVGTLLVSLGGDVNITNSNGQTCLHVASKSGNRDFINMLLENGADPSIQDNDGNVASAEEFALAASCVASEEPKSPPLESMPTTQSVGNLSTITVNGSVASGIATMGSSRPQSTLDGGDDDVVGMDDVSMDSSVQESGYDTDSGWDDEEGDSAPHRTKKERRAHAEGNSYVPHDVNTKQIILWPPTQRQTQYSPQSNSHRPLRLDSKCPVVISSASAGIDIYPLLTWSGLVDTFERLGFSSQVQRGATSAHVSLAINQAVCPGRHRFEIRIDAKMARLTASDSTGLMYATQAFIQIITLHADMISSDGESSSFFHADHDDSYSSGVRKGLEVPAMVIVDWPDVPNRGVLWSHRLTVRTQSAEMKKLIRLLSNLRINQLFLGVDLDGAVKGGGTTSPAACMRSAQLLNTKLCSLDEVCRRLFVELVPTVTITNMHHRLPIETLRSFSGTSVCVLLDMQDVEAAADTSKDLFEEACDRCVLTCRQILQDALTGGCTTVVLACSGIMKEVLGDIQAMAMDVGVVLIEYPLLSFLSSKLMNKSLLSAQAAAKHVLARVEKVHLQGSTLALFPAHSDSDFFFPALLQKHACFLHAGACWNRAAFEDILGPSKQLDDHTLLRPTLNLMLFSPRLASVKGEPSLASSTTSEFDILRRAVLDILTGTLPPHALPPSPSPSRRANKEEPFVASLATMAKAEGLLWALISGAGYPLDMTIPVSRSEAVECLRKVKSVMASVEWGRREELFRGIRNAADSSSSNGTTGGLSEQSTGLEGASEVADIDEYMTTLQLFGICCKAVILAYNAAEKRKSFTGEFHSLRDMVECLSPGTASDLANGLLEAISHCSYRWRRRFEDSMELCAAPLMAQYSKPKQSRDHLNISTDSIVHDRISSVRSTKQLKSMEKTRYVHTARAEIPGITLFSALCTHIPAYTVDVLLKVVEPPEQPARLPSRPSSSSWSLWGSR